MRSSHITDARAVLERPPEGIGAAREERKGRFSVIFSRVGRLWGQFWVPKLAPIDSAMERGIVGHILKNFSATGPEGIGAPRPELQGKT